MKRRVIIIINKFNLKVQLYLEILDMGILIMTIIVELHSITMFPLCSLIIV